MTLTVRLSPELHRAVKVRAAQEGHAVESLARGWFETYAAGDTLVGMSAGAEVEMGAVRRRGLVAGEPGPVIPDGGGAVTSPPSPAVSPRFRPDPKPGGKK